MLLETLSAGYEAIDAGDYDRFAELVSGLLTPDCEVRGPQYKARGPEQIVPIWVSFAEAFPDGRHEWLVAQEFDGGAVLEMRYTGTHTATLETPNGPLPGTGRSVSLDVAVVLTTRDGRVTSWHDYMDTSAFAQQLGLMPVS
jgi:SnoaL-like protein